jgi:thiol-disulfide isomerase/thioredoxin
VLRPLALLFLLFVVSPAVAEVPLPLADSEGALLHRQLDLGAVMQWSRQLHTWQPLKLPLARVYVVNLWGVSCRPCRDEFPVLRNIVRAWRRSPEVVFLFVADPPLENIASEVEQFWQKPPVDLPDADPCRSSDERLRQNLGSNVQPLTLLLDANLIIRQAFVGAITDRPLGNAIERLLQIAPPPPVRRRGIATHQTK